MVGFHLWVCEKSVVIPETLEIHESSSVSEKTDSRNSATDA